MKEVKKRMLRRIMAAALSLAMVFSSVQTVPGLSMTALAAESTPETSDVTEPTDEINVPDQTEPQTTAAPDGEDTSTTVDPEGSEDGDVPETGTPDTPDDGDKTGTPDTPDGEDVSGTTPGGAETNATESEQVTIKLHFKNTDNWPEVGVYQGDSGWKNMNANWPGVKIAPDANHPSYYTFEVTKDKSLGLVCIFNDNQKENGQQTGDLVYEAEDFAGSDTFEQWIIYTGYKEQSIETTAPADWGSSEEPGDKVVSPEVNGREVTFRYKNETANEVYVAGTMNGWNDKADKMEKGADGIHSLKMQLDIGETYQYKFVVDGEWMPDPSNDKKVGNDNNSLLVVYGIYDEEIDVTKGEANKLPKELRRMTEDGETEEYVAVTYATKEANVQGVKIEGNEITIDEAYAEATLELTATATVGEKTETATLTLNIVAEKLISPEVDGKKVTFRYQSATAQAVSVVYGDNLREEMTKAADSDVFKCEVELEPGKYLYQFSVDGEMKKDPKNIRTENGKSVVYVAGLAATKFNVATKKTTVLPEQVTMLTEEGKETQVDATYAIKTAVTGVSLDDAGKVITVGDYKGAIEMTVKATVDAQEYTADITVNAVEDTNKITLNLHYHRSDNKYDDWNVWGWMTGASGIQYDFKAGDDDQVLTVEFDDARSVDAFNYIIRKGDWADREDFGDRLVDLSDILCGTVDFYVESGVKEGIRVLGDDVLTGVKVLSAIYDNGTTNEIKVKTGTPIAGSIDGVFTVKAAGEEITITSVTADENTYTLVVDADLTSVEEQSKAWILVFDEYEYKISMPSAYSTEAFEKEYTYTGNDLGATWTSSKTTFKVWAPTAEKVEVFLYDSGVKGEGQPEAIEMTLGKQGVWSAEKSGDIKGKFYTYNVTIGGESKEACDPYARTTGVNGDRAMVIDLDSTDPEGWAGDAGSNQGMSYTDSVIYELHVRDFSIDASSGIQNKGKFLGLTEKGTTNSAGQTTGLDYLVDLGVNYVHLLPSYDYATVDETKLDTPQYNWGYDPKNYNVPEGSYSTDPYDGAVRVNEMKQMVKALHDNNINVIMDVVYNHVYSADDFCFNQIVPQYFSRVNADGAYSNGSGCGNDTASERSMVKKYIVDSVNYWADEYHIDGFRFDLVGLLDTETINEIVSTVHAKHPDVIFYGEGWTMSTDVTKEGYTLATQVNSALTPGFAYFSDNMRDTLKGSVFDAEVPGFVSGAPGMADDVITNFMATPPWSSNPTQIVNYASCHDNYTLWDKLQLSTDVSEADRIKMNNLAAAIYMTAEGIPFIHAGEELLRTKVKEDGSLEHNSYNSSDFVNSFKWDDLNDETHRQVRDYYKGLIEFRQSHAALRRKSASDVQDNIQAKKLGDQTVMFVINGNDSISSEISDGIVVIFNAANSAQTINLYENGAAQGTWQVCINGEQAGTKSLASVQDGMVTVEPISAMVLVKEGNAGYTEKGYRVTFDYNCELGTKTIDVEPG
ncbi:MAG: type I pullulanase, partial [Lachnospiraceae bacterium]|nr:type I pullulanase [Lachnospiraceae bacterium]